MYKVSLLIQDDRFTVYNIYNPQGRLYRGVSAYSLVRLIDVLRERGKHPIFDVEYLEEI